MTGSRAGLISHAFGIMKCKYAEIRSSERKPIRSCRKGQITDKNRTATIRQSVFYLTLKGYELLKMFMESPGRVFTRDTILQSVWSTEFSRET